MSVREILGDIGQEDDSQEEISGDLPPLLSVCDKLYMRIDEKRAGVFRPLVGNDPGFEDQDEFDRAWEKAASAYHAMDLLSKCIRAGSSYPDVNVKNILAWYYLHSSCKSLGQLSNEQWMLADQAGNEMFSENSSRDVEIASYTQAQALAFIEFFVKSILDNFEELIPAVSVIPDPEEERETRARHCRAMKDAVAFAFQCIGDIRRECLNQELSVVIESFRKSAQEKTPQAPSLSGPLSQPRNQGVAR